jgi:hypothetical protein
LNRKQFLLATAGIYGTALFGPFTSLESPHDQWQRGLRAAGLMAAAATRLPVLPRSSTVQYAHVLRAMGSAVSDASVRRLRQMVSAQSHSGPTLKGTCAAVELQTGHFDEAATLAKESGLARVGTLELSALAEGGRFESLLEACERVRQTPGLHPAYVTRAHLMALRACHAVGRPLDSRAFLTRVSKMGDGAGPINELLWMVQGLHDHADTLGLPRIPTVARVAHALAMALYRSSLPQRQWQPLLERSIERLATIPEAAQQWRYLHTLRNSCRAPGGILVTVEMGWKWLPMVDPLLEVPVRIRRHPDCNLPRVGFGDNVMLPENDLAISVGGRRMTQFSAPPQSQSLARFETELLRVAYRHASLLSSWKDREHPAGEAWPRPPA